MFTRALNPALASDIADEIFTNIDSVSFNGDSTFVATLRALLAPRMSEDDYITVVTKFRHDRESVLKGYSSKSEGALALSKGLSANMIYICSIDGTDASVNASFDILDNGFVEVCPSYTDVKGIDAFFLSHLRIKARFFISKELRSTAVFIEGLDIPLWHAIQGFMSMYLPWYFEEKPLTEDERNLLRAITLKTATSYEKLIADYAEQYDFRTKRISKLLDGFETLSQNQRLSGLLNNISNVERNIDNNVNQYLSLISQREELIIQKLGLEQQIFEKKDSTEIVDYFIHNKHLNPTYVSGSSLDLIINTYLELFDVDMFESYNRNINSFYYRGYDVTASAFVNAKAREKLLSVIFCDSPILKIKMCAYYRINLSGSVSSSSGYNFPSEYSDMMPNPHLQNYNCLGSYRVWIESALRNGDTIFAIEQCVASAKSVNVGEEASFKPFLRDLFSSSCKKVIELPDGTSVTPTEAYEWLLEQEKAKEVEE